MSCPLTLAYLKETGRHLDHASIRVLYGTIIDHINNLKERAEVVPGTKEFQRLRGFFCVEVMYSDLVRRSLNQDKLLNKWRGGTIALAPIIQKLIKPVPRSWEGLSSLIERVGGLDDEVTVQLTELTFARQDKVGQSEEVMVEERFNKTMKVFEVCTDAAKTLRRSLGNDDLPLQSVGRALALALDILRVPHQERVNYGLILLNISPDNPVTPWPTKSESPV